MAVQLLLCGVLHLGLEFYNLLKNANLLAKVNWRLEDFLKNCIKNSQKKQQKIAKLLIVKYYSQSRSWHLKLSIANQNNVVPFINVFCWLVLLLLLSSFIRLSMTHQPFIRPRNTESFLFFFFHFRFLF